MPDLAAMWTRLAARYWAEAEAAELGRAASAPCCTAPALQNGSEARGARGAREPVFEPQTNGGPGVAKGGFTRSAAWQVAWARDSVPSSNCLPEARQ